MRKIILILISFITVIIVWQSISFYFEINKPLRTNQDQALNYIQENTDIKFIDKINFYHGVESYYVAEGTNIDGEKQIIWVPTILDNNIVIKSKDDGISQEDVLAFVQKELAPKEIISIKLGMENSIPLYEIIYRDQKNRYSYYFISFTDGTYLKNYHL